MKKPKLVASVIFILLIISAFVFALSNKKATAPKDSQVSAPTSTPTTAMDEEQMPNATSRSETTSPGQYIDYSETNLANASGQKVLFFHAPWCPQCRSIEKTILEDKASIPSGITVFKVDYDSHQTLRQKYGVTIQTTFVKVDDSGNLIAKYVAYDDPTIESVRKNFLL